MVKKLLVSLILISVTIISSAQPEPRKTEFFKGSLMLRNYTITSHCQELDPAVKYLSLYLSPKGGEKTIELSLGCEKVTEPEGYELTVNRKGVKICGVDYAGIFNGIQQLLRMLPAQIYSRKGLDTPVELPFCRIEDWPDFHYRGVMLDLARTWVPIDQIYRLVDNMAYQNLNILHLHLCDNEAWRVEILSHPELAQIGGFRSPEGKLKPIYGKYDECFGGFYTQKELRELVKFASDRNVEIVPEIDLPGHSRAIAAVMPSILCDWQTDTTKTAGVDFRDVWCVSKEENYTLIKEILTEIANLFPSPRIHIGGDEVGMNNWLSCPLCSAKMKESGFSDAHQLEDMFMKRVTDIVKELGKTPMAWWDEDVIKDNFPKGSILYGWQSFASCVKAIDKGHPTVLAPAHYCYFDMHQREFEDGDKWGGVVDFDKVFSLKNEIASLSPEQKKGIVGILGAFWAETCTSHNPENTDYQDFMLFPRLLAIARLGWNLSSAYIPAQESFPKLDAMGLNYWKPSDPPAPENLIKPELTISSSMDQDESKPFSIAALYEGVSYTGRCPKVGDWVQYDFKEPVVCSKIDLHTGYFEFPSAVIASGQAYVSYDGVNYEPAGRLFNGGVSIYPTKAVKSLRAVSDRHGNGFYMLVIQPLKIFK